jgi:hypothetical protein
MSIIVVCPGCLKSFKVSDKFAGKTGPCPNCKRTLKVPTKQEEVKVHAPEEFGGGGKSVSGKLITKPIARVNAKLHPVATTLLAAAVLLVLAATWLGRHLGLFDCCKIFDIPLAAIVGLLAVSPPLTVAAYEMLRDDEFEPYRGTALYLRACGCGLAYAALWAVFALLASRGIVTGEWWNWIIILLPFVGIGGLAGAGAFDLEFGDAVLHYSFYLLATALLRWIAGMKWVWDITT